MSRRVPRSPEESRDEHGLRWVRADVDDEQSVARAMEGAEVAYYLVHSLGKAGFEERERRSADGFARQPRRLGSARSFTSAGSATTRITSRRTYGAAGRRHGAPDHAFERAWS
jgi:uncharacterized protein YbjT (DUF2867 family)